MSDPDILSEDDPNYWPPYEYAMPIARPVSSELPKAAAAPPSPATVVEPLAAQLSPSASTPESAPRDAEPTARGRASQSASGARTYGHHASGSATLALRLPNLNAPDMFPAFMSRSALFGAFRPNTGGSLAGDIRAAGAATIAFQGPRLSMLDKRVWEALVRLAKAGRLNVSEPFDIPLAAIAAESGLAKSSTRAAWLSMQRLAAARVDAIVEGARCEGLLLAEARRCGNHCSAKLDPAFAIPALSEVLLAAMPATPVRFGSSPLSQWLLDFFSTHEQAEKPFTLDYLRSLSGYGSIAKHFPSDLRKALASLKARAPRNRRRFLHRRASRRQRTMAAVDHPRTGEARRQASSETQSGRRIPSRRGLLCPRQQGSAPSSRPRALSLSQARADSRSRERR